MAKRRAKRGPKGLRGIYARHNVLWISYTGTDGRRRRRATPFVPGQEVEAAKLRTAVLRKLAADDASTPGETVPLTLAAFSKEWIETRKTLVARWRDDQMWLSRYVLPVLGQLPITEIRRRHLAELFCAIRESGKLAPKSVHNVYGTLQALFKAAVRAEVVPSSPCTLDKYELGPKVDADPEWRASALFTRDELELLISDERIPADRRMLYGLLGLAGLRLGEAAGLRWRHYHPETEPLGKLVIATSYNTGRTKTQQTREMPVHPTLAAMLAQWRLSGWAALMGRAPGPDDLVAPMAASLKLPLGSMWTKERAYGRRKTDLERLGLRHRRGHDLRRTFISLALEDGARRDLLKRCTHGVPRSEAFDCYVTIGWRALCNEVAKLRVQRREAAVQVVVPLLINARGERDPGPRRPHWVTGSVTAGSETARIPTRYKMTPPGLEPGISA